MIGNHYEIYDKDNNKYIIQEYQSGFTCKKVLEDNTLVDPTIEELQYIINELQKLKSTEPKYDYNSVLKNLKKMIDDGILNSLDEIKNYVEYLDIPLEEKDKLVKDGYQYLESKSKNNTPITTFKTKLIEHLRKERKEGSLLSVSFDVIDNLSGPSYCKISLDNIEDNKTTNLEINSFDYNEELKKELIEPVLEELILSTEVYPLDIRPVPGGIYRSNLNLSTTNNKTASLNNIEDSYATSLSEHLNALMNEAKIPDAESRDNRIEALSQEKKNQKIRKREKTENQNGDKKGFSSVSLIYAIICAITSLTVLMQIILFN